MLNTKLFRFPIAASVMLAIFFGVIDGGIGNVSGEEGKPQEVEDPRSLPVETLDDAVKSGRIPIEVVKRADSEGIAPIIVKMTLPEPFTPEGNLDNRQIESQRTNITAAQRSILSAIAKQGQFDDVKQFEMVPWMSMQADTKTLLVLAKNRNVFRIMEDGLNEAHLATSVPLIGADIVQRSLGNAGAGQTVAILDTGVDGTHSFLSGKVVSEGCFSTSMPFTSTNVCPSGDSTASGSGVACPVGASANCGHGTHVAGIAVGKNATQPGVAPEANIISVQVFSDMHGAGVSAYDSDIVQGLEHVYTLRNGFEIAAVNMSLGDSDFFTNQTACDDDHEGFKNAIDNLRSVGIATVATSGNSAFPFNAGVEGPGCISSAIAVGATMGTGTGETVAIWPNATGVGGSASQTGTLLDLLAPGTNISSSLLSNTFAPQSGTSMAAPHVAGAFAVLNQQDPWQSVASQVNALTSTGIPITDTRPATPITTPRVQLNAAIEAYTGSPLTPSAVTVDDFGGTWIQASWTDNSNAESSFRLIATPAVDALAPSRSATVATNVTSAIVGDQIANDGSILKLRPNTLYNVSVEACDAAGTCGASPSVPVRTLDTTPFEPTMLRLTDATSSGLTLRWDQDDSKPVTHFQLVRYACGTGYDCNPATPAIELDAAYRSYVVSGLIGNWQYNWRLQACNEDGCSDWVNGPSIGTPSPGTPPAAPTNVHICGDGTEPMELCSIADLTVMWDDNSGDEDFFEVNWAIAQPGIPPFNSTWSTAATPNNREAYNLTYWLPGTIYYFQVRACNIYGCSVWSNVVIHSTAS